MKHFYVQQYGYLYKMNIYTAIGLALEGMKGNGHDLNKPDIKRLKSSPSRCKHDVPKVTDYDVKDWELFLENIWK